MYVESKLHLHRDRKIRLSYLTNINLSTTNIGYYNLYVQVTAGYRHAAQLRVRRRILLKLVCPYSTKRRIMS